MKLVIFDLDGTLADIEERRQLAMKSGKMNWDIFFDPNNIKLDKPIQSIIYLYNKMIKDNEVDVMIFSGRSEITRQATLRWFKHHEIPYPQALKMRQEEDYTPDEELKKEWLHKIMDNFGLTIKDIIFVVDDRSKVVKMWRELGLTCLQVAEGDF